MESTVIQLLKDDRHAEAEMMLQSDDTLIDKVFNLYMMGETLNLYHEDLQTNAAKNLYPLVKKLYQKIIDHLEENNHCEVENENIPSSVVVRFMNCLINRDHANADKILEPLNEKQKDKIFITILLNEMSNYISSPIFNDKLPELEKFKRRILRLFVEHNIVD